MTVKDLVLKNRSYRRFAESETISLGTLKELVDLGRP
jgi:nitroreductase